MPNDNASFGSQANASAITSVHRQFVLNANETLSAAILDDFIILVRNLPSFTLYLYQSVGAVGATWFGQFSVDDDFVGGLQVPLWLPLTAPAALAFGIPSVNPFRFAVNFARIQLTAPAANGVTVDVVIAASV